jgi:hypothetical protein
MGKNTITEEAIYNLINDGWYFRIETLHSNDYITVIKGDKEKSLGPYVEGAWKTIVKLKGGVFYPEDDF